MSKRPLQAVNSLSKRQKTTQTTLSFTSVTSSISIPSAHASTSVQVASSTVTGSTSSTNAFSGAPLSTTTKSGHQASEKDLLQLEVDSIDPSWFNLLQQEMRKSYFLDLKSFLWSEGLRGVADSKKAKVFPPAQDIYSWSRYAPLHTVKVVIIGQDPYHDDGQAHGLCFSVRPGVKIPPSLRNIYKEIKNEYPDFVLPKHGNLISWAKSGVLLLNTSLTVKPHQAGSHSKKGWETFTDKVVDLVDRYGGAGAEGEVGKGVVFLAWGAWAAKRVEKLDKKKHLILTSAHPSPLSASRGFLGNGHFKKANEWLKEKYGHDGIVEWTTLDEKAGENQGERV
ncbi:uracil-DNA glycosylase [Meredithblackwellia eburnea MCA 4105]